MKSKVRPLTIHKLKQLGLNGGSTLFLSYHSGSEWRRIWKNGLSKVMNCRNGTLSNIFGWLWHLFAWFCILNFILSFSKKLITCSKLLVQCTRFTGTWRLTGACSSRESKTTMRLRGASESNASSPTTSTTFAWSMTFSASSSGQSRSNCIWYLSQVRTTPTSPQSNSTAISCGSPGSRWLSTQWEDPSGASSVLRMSTSPT